MDEKERRAMKAAKCQKVAELTLVVNNALVHSATKAAPVVAAASVSPPQSTGSDESDRGCESDTYDEDNVM